jgi:hypothetical protein
MSYTKQINPTGHTSRTHFKIHSIDMSTTTTPPSNDNNSNDEPQPLPLTQDELTFVQEFCSEATASAQESKPIWKQWNTTLVDDLSERYTQRRTYLVAQLQRVEKQRTQIIQRRQMIEYQISQQRNHLRSIGARDAVAKKRKMDTEGDGTNRRRPYFSLLFRLISVQDDRYQSWMCPNDRKGL